MHKQTTMNRTELLIKIKLEARKCLTNCKNMATLRKLAFLSIIYTNVKHTMYRTIRSIFYDYVNIFSKQNCINRLVKLYIKRFGCTRTDLFLTATLKGMFEGEVSFSSIKNNKEVLVRMAGKHLIPDMNAVVSIRHGYTKVLVIEKDSVFTALARQDYLTVCGKGYPCWNTLTFLEMLEGTAEIFCMTDYDPYGIDIFMVYRRRIPSIRRLGLCSLDLFCYDIDTSACIKLSMNDLKMIERLKKKVNFDDGLKEELLFMQGVGCKLELECLVWNDKFDIEGYLGWCRV